MLYHKKHSSTVFIDAENNIFSSKADITVKNGNYGIVNNTTYDARLLINNNITVTLKGSGEYAVGINAAKSVSQIVSSDIKKTTKVSFVSDSANDVSAYGWRSSTRSWNIGGSELLHNFNISCKGATASAYGIYGRGISSSAVFKSNFTVSAHGSQNAYAYALYITFSAVDLHTLAGKFTITANSPAGGEACGIFSTRDVSVDNITGSWNITGKDAANAWGIQAAGKTVIGNFAANISVSGLESRVFHIEEIPEEDAVRSFEANSIAGKITAAAIYSAYGISSWGSVSIGDMSKMNMKITGKKGNAYGFYIFDEVKGNSEPENLIIAEGGLDVGKISVTAAETAYGIYVYDAIAASEEIKINHITGSITAKGRNAYGIEANSFTETIKSIDYNTICSASISATGSDFACGIQFNEGDLTLDGSKITAKTTDKNYKAANYAVKAAAGKNNTISLTGKAQLTGRISAGDNADADTVIIESGSQLTGSLQGVEELELLINDTGSRKNAMWVIKEIWSDDSAVNISIDASFGIIGDFKLATKSKNIQWDELYKNAVTCRTVFNGSEISTDLFQYSTYTKGNNLYLRSEINRNADAAIFEDKITEQTTVTQKYAYFSSRANINTGDLFGIFVFDNDNTVAGFSSTYLALENNIVVNSKDNTTAIGLVSDADLYAAISPGKSIKVTAKAAGASAYGIDSRGNLVMENFTADITVSGVTNAYGLHEANTKDKTLTAASLSGRMNVAAKNSDKISGTAQACGLYVYNDINLSDGIFNAWNITADGREAKAYGIHTKHGMIHMDTAIIANKLTVTAKSTTSSEAYGICCTTSNTPRPIRLAGISGAFTIKASGSSYYIQAYGIYSKYGMSSTGALSGNFTVEAKARDTAKALAYGIYIGGTNSGSCHAYLSDITGKWNIKAQGSKDTQAFAVSTEDEIIIGKLSGNITVTESNSDKNNVSDDHFRAGAFETGETLDIESISGKITVTGTNACGFSSGAMNNTKKATDGDMTLGDMSKATLKVTAKRGSAFGIYARKQAKLLISDKLWDFGKITVTGVTQAAGIMVGGGIAARSNTEEQMVSSVINGTITVKATNAKGVAWGIVADNFNNVVLGANISATAAKNAVGVRIYNGNLVLDGAKITAKATGKSSGKSNYAVQVFDTGNDNTIELKGKSSLTGDIYTNTGTDKVIIESGSKLKGDLLDVEELEFDLNDPTHAKNVLWESTRENSIGTDLGIDLNIDLEPGMTGDFQLVKKRSGNKWSSIFDTIYLNDDESKLLVSGNAIESDYLAAFYSDGDYNFSLKEKGNVLILSVTIAD